MSKQFGKIRTKVAHYFYNALIKKIKQKDLSSFKLSSVKSIGIIFDNYNSDVNYFINDLSKEFKQKIGFVSIYKLAYNIPEGNKHDTDGIPVVYFSDKDTNWYGKPKFKDVISFLETPFNLLINIGDNNSWTIKFCVLNSNAKFKVGRLNDHHELYDLMIDTKKNSNDKELYKAIIEYLKLINS